MLMKASTNTPSNSLIDSTMNPKVKTKGERVRVCSLVRNTSRVKGHARISGWGLGQVTSGSITPMDLHKLNNKLVSV